MVNVPDHYTRLQEMWCDENDYCHGDRLIKWRNGYKKHKAQKAQIKEELLRVGWHPSRWWDWCIPEDDKKETEKLWK